MHSERDPGASLVEYALLIAFIALIVLAAIAVLGGDIKMSLSSAGSVVPGGSGSVG